jgi:hypothetical protein
MMKDLEGALETQALSRPMVQRTNMAAQLVIRENAQVGVLGETRAKLGTATYFFLDMRFFLV